MNIKKYILAFASVLIFLSVTCFAQNDMTIKFSASEPDENGVFKLDVSFEKMEFLTYQFAVRYNKSAVEPIDSETGKTAQSFDEFSEFAKPDGLYTVGEYLSTQDGFFDFSGYVFPNDKKSGLVQENGNAKTGENFLIYTLYFNKLSDEDYGFEFAMADGNGVYYNVFPQGASVYCIDGLREANAVFTYGGKTENVQFDSVKYAPKPVMTKARRLKNTIYLQSGNYASSCDGVLAVIDADNKEVKPEYQDGKLYVPLRFVCSYFGFEIGWDEQTKTVSVTKEDKTTALEIGNKAYSEGGIAKELSQSPKIVNERTMICTDDLSTLFGLNVYFPDDEKSAVITTSDEEWQNDRDAEKQALEAMKFVVSPFVKIFA